ncbi:MAG: type II secretion system protein M, partial [Armatimonadetes bacterium]|nr:type II secretion system protein M [Armatimonadota bacterium]
MSRRERILLIIVSVLVTFVGWYFYLYSPRQAEYVRLTQTLEERRGQLKQMEATALRITQLE